MCSQRPAVVLGVVLGLLFIGSSFPNFAQAAPTSELTFEERVDAQRAIEDVYWRHRLWPDDNPQAKPSLAQLMAESEIHKKVNDYLAKARIVEGLRKRPLTGRELQAEINRMARNSRQPQILRDLFAALDNDPLLIAQCLALPQLADRFARGLYASDNLYQARLRTEVEQKLRKLGSVDLIRNLGGQYGEAVIVLMDGADWRTTPEQVHDTDIHRLTRLDTHGWRKLIAKLADRFFTSRVSETSHVTESTIFSNSSDIKHTRDLAKLLPQNQISALFEENAYFGVHAVLSKENGKLRLATVRWPKFLYEDWLEARRNHLAQEDTTQGVEAEFNGIALEVFKIQLPSISGPSCVPDTWTSMPVGAPSERWGHTAVWTGSEMIIWGAYSGTFGAGGRYDPATDTWAPIAIGIGSPTARGGHTAVWTGTEMIIWGGTGGSQHLQTGGRYNPTTNSWISTSTGANTPTARSAHAATWTGEEMIVWGGAGGGSILNSGGRYDPSSNTWVPTSISENVPSGRSRPSAVWTGREMIVWGGYIGLALTNTGGRYDPSTDSWNPTEVGNSAPSIRQQHTAIWTGSEMIIWGGWDGTVGGRLHTGGRYNLSSDTWVPTSEGPGTPEGRASHTAVWTGTEMIIWGGSSSTTSLNSGSRYNPYTETWIPTSQDLAAPWGRWGHTAVWTGEEMIIWGGRKNESDTNSGGRYNPKMDTWLMTSAAPSPRIDHSVVWTGTEMLIWGGRSAELNHAFKSGGRYSPSLDIWTPTSNGPNSPEARTAHTAVWTGTEMIVWGGRPTPYVSTVINTGGRYDPTLDTWLPTAKLPQLPYPRGEHTAVWTGTEMIVWGGRALPYYFNSGERYDPVSDSWTRTSTAGDVPIERFGHTAVWTGTEMIVWGGASYNKEYNYGFYVNTGGRYDPLADLWISTAVSEINVPTARTFHTASWTGSEMIIWGGRDVGGSFVNTGGLFDPLSDTWLPTSTTSGVPTGRRDHTAIWTGSEMIVWGGAELDFPGSYTNTGGRYNLISDTWEFISGAGNALTGREGHTAVWTGAEMLLWGGAARNGDLWQDFNSGASYCVFTWLERADIDESGRVDGFDLVRIAKAFGSSGCGSPRYDSPADLNNDCSVDGQDLAILAEYFGQVR